MDKDTKRKTIIKLRNFDSQEVEEIAIVNKINPLINDEDES